LLCLELEDPPPLQVAAAERGAGNDVSGGFWSSGQTSSSRQPSEPAADSAHLPTSSSQHAENAGSILCDAHSTYMK
jgi:hypothetical protein